MSNKIAFSQSIFGKITDSKGKSIDFATITLKKHSDSSFVTGTICDENGNFELKDLKKGNYLMYASVVGYKTYISQKLVIPAENSPFYIQLEEDSKMLGEVQVRSQKPIFEQEAGKTVVNVENSIVSQGLMAIELLKRTPGVVIDNDGNISLKGKENVLLMIDGKPTYLSAKQAAAILKSLPSNQIANIEVMTTPPAKYDAEGNAGVININLRKGSLSGLNGAVHGSFGHGFKPKSNVGASITSGAKKWTLGAAYDFTANEDFNIYTQNRSFGSFGSNQRYRMVQRYDVPFYSNTYRLSADFQANNKLSFSATHRGIVSSDVYYGNNNTGLVVDAQEKVVQKLISNDHNPDRYYNFSGGLGSKYKIDSSGHELSADVDLSYYHQKSSQTTSSVLYENSSPVASNISNWDGQLPTYVYNIAAKIDYVRPISKNLKLEIGLKHIDISIDSDVQYIASQSGPLVLNLPTSNHFVYQENISAAYASIDYKREKWSFVLGLRTEWWQAEGKQLNSNEKFRRDSIVPFPTATLKYKIFEKHEIGLNYNKRIDRPEYNSLNPISYYSDPYTVFQGNPRLRPQLADNFELSHSFMDGALITTLNYSEISNYIIDFALIPNSDSTKPQAMTTINIPRFRNVGISVSLYVPITKYWTSQIFVNGFQNQYSGNIFGEELNITKWAFLANTTQSLALPKDWSVELSGTYLSPTLEGYTLVKSMGMLSLGVQKSLIKSNATIKLAAQDVFYTFIYNTETNFGGLDATNNFRWDNRIVTLSFSWKFGRNRFGSDNVEEESQIKTGGRK
ncbi:MAG: TonB-dependent receptor domain-containing protein [Cytophagales bacterium]